MHNKNSICTEMAACMDIVCVLYFSVYNIYVCAHCIQFLYVSYCSAQWECMMFHLIRHKVCLFFLLECVHECVNIYVCMKILLLFANALCQFTYMSIYSPTTNV